MNTPTHIEITDVFLRDGLQDEAAIVSTADKLEIARRLQEVGLRRIEVASFVNPTRVPQMGDADAIYAGRPDNAVAWTALTLNARGIERAEAAGATEIAVVTSASDSHSAENAGASAAAMLENLRPAIETTTCKVVAGISTAFACPFEGDISPEQLISVMRPFVDMGITTIGLADTLGTAEPDYVIDSLSRVIEAFPEATLSLHLHNAHGKALETVTKAVELGITKFDSAIGGFGGCPFAPGAAGNLDTVDLVRQLHALGHDTGIDLPALTQLAADATSIVAGSPTIPQPVA